MRFIFSPSLPLSFSPSLSLSLLLRLAVAGSGVGGCAARSLPFVGGFTVPKSSVDGWAFFARAAAVLRPRVERRRWKEDGGATVGAAMDAHGKGGRRRRRRGSVFKQERYVVDKSAFRLTGAQSGSRRPRFDQ